jgi:Superfamily I DNA and RNA helicases
MSIHSAKGLEFGAVFIIGLEEGVFPELQIHPERGGY